MVTHLKPMCGHFFQGVTLCCSGVKKRDAHPPGAGKPIVYVPKNDVSSVPLRGAVAVLSEKFKPGTMSDGALLQKAYQAGADAVIKIGGGGLDPVRSTSKSSGFHRSTQD